MVSVSAVISALTVAAIATTTSVDAHGTLSKPGLKFTGTAYGGDFSALVPMTSLKAQGSDKLAQMDANVNAAVFERAFKASQYKTLKDFILKNQDMAKGRSKMPKTAECGFTDPTGGAVQPLPDQLEWYGGGMNHPGPCEVWCDNEVVLPFTGNCQKTFPNGKFTYDKAKCVGKSRLTMFWMSTLLEWQVYIDCAKIGGGGGAAAGGAAAGGAAAGGAAARNNGGNKNGAARNGATKSRSLDFGDLYDEEQPASEYNTTAEADARSATDLSDYEADAEAPSDEN
jgi:hypothetical protein